ncbi:hypothetical protein HHI36_009291 [Cryptolaemus montrouzieri]|uniref:Uncharacterized protein n=1 Tax=Cryptolaemus montrouzieri TaxID=559131 RepID=A0ABD2MVD3_9CUCU
MYYYAIILLISSFIFLEISTNQVYTIIHEKAELISYNASLAKPDVVFSFRKVNKTDFAFNTSFTTLRDFTDRKVLVKLAFDKLYGGEYKRTGSTLTVNLCKFYEKNTFGFRDVLKKYSNFELCDIKKV